MLHACTVSAWPHPQLVRSVIDIVAIYSGTTCIKKQEYAQSNGEAARAVSVVFPTISPTHLHPTHLYSSSYISLLTFCIVYMAYCQNTLTFHPKDGSSKLSEQSARLCQPSQP